MVPQRKAEPIVVQTEKYGALYLSRALTFGLFSDLSRVQKSGTDAREFTVQTILRLLCLPEMTAEEIRAWPDELLIQVARAWVTGRGESDWPMPDDLPPFQAFQHGFAAYKQRIYRDMAESIGRISMPALDQSLGRFESFNAAITQQAADMSRRLAETMRSSIAEMVEASLRPVRESLAKIASSLTLTIDVGRLIPSLPDLGEIARRHEKYVRAADILDESGYPFMRLQWSFDEIVPFVGIDQRSPRVRDAAITNRLLGMTRGADFRQRLEALFANSAVLQRRWRIVQEALDAHRKRQYALSVPALLAQVEGIFTDALILKDMAIRHDGKLCARGPDGSIKLNKNGGPVELHGLGQKVQNARFHEGEMLRDLVDFFADGLVTERNDIMHGTRVGYDKARLSVQLILNVYVLAAELADFEGRS